MIPGRHDIEVYEGNGFRIPAVAIYDMSPYGGPASLAEAGVSVAARIVPASNPAAAVEMDVEVLDPVVRRVRVSLPSSRTRWGPGAATWELRVTKGAYDEAILAGRAALLDPS